ncbi:hypothetical protein C2G38_2191758 [Gigaspora rosea]|uniref:Uncharacterized protein n=1 Tax=Gigaspora rosea TaxID=44941 RepID=A0A397V007_9GLOM|nr:hypothetical protein C2G38_2191758 [Gigaspora rosea]CAG8784624.1 21550_t:CDS:2 [Gigaspora rosea]
MANEKSLLQSLTPGYMLEELHYGPFCTNWWYFSKKPTQNAYQYGTRPGFLCGTDTQNQIYNAASTAINETYQKHFGNKTRYSGPSVLGFDDDNIVSQLLENIAYILFYINYNNKNILIAKLGISNNADLNFARSGYLSIFMQKIDREQKRIVQSINENSCTITVYYQEKILSTQSDSTPIKVWKK